MRVLRVDRLLESQSESPPISRLLVRLAFRGFDSQIARHSSRGTFGISRSSLNEISGAHRSRTMCWTFTLKGAAWTPPHRP